MSASPDSTSADLEQTIVDLRRGLTQLTAERDQLLAERDEAYRRLDDAQARETATAEVLGIINASTGDLAPVFDAILEKAHSLCGIAHGSLELYDGERFRAVAVRGLSETFADLLRQGSPAFDNPATRPLIEGERFSYIADMAKSDYSIERTAAETGARTLLCVPLRREGQLLGMIASGSREVRPFSEKETALLENFAAQAVIAMDNARLLGELRQRTLDLQQSLEYQTATSDVLKVISRTEARPESALETLVATAARICVADQGAIHQLRGGLHFVSASVGTNPEYRDYVARNPIAPGRGTAIGRMALEGRPIHIEDVLADPEYTGSEFQRLAGFRSVLAVPLLREDVVIGSILLTRSRVEPFIDKQIELVCTFADQAVIAIENARLLSELRERTDEVAGWNRELEARVAAQVDELGRVGRLKRFLAPQLAELIVSQGDEKILESHRREIVVVFCDLRGYTAFSETAEPEEVLDFLREYHGALGPLVSQFEGTLDQFSGDGIMAYFNDPLPIPDPAERAVKMAIAMREATSSLTAAWRERGRELGFGAGVAQGYATLGQIGFSERSGYTAIGTVCNVAARLCGEAKDGQILLSQRVNVALKGSVATEQVGALALKGLTQPVIAYNVPLTPSQPALRVIDGGNH
jgi:class 3 adenylate cyclase